MNDVPLLFAETVARLIDDESLQKLTDLNSSHFGNVGRSLWENGLLIYLNVVYNSTTKTFDYCLHCRRCNGNNSYGPGERYTYDPADHQLVRSFGVRLLRDRSSLHIPQVTWTSATSSDPTLLKLLRAPFAQSFLDLYTNCLETLKLLPDYCTFNFIVAPIVYNEVLEAIIHRSQECGRLESLFCTKFFTKRGRKASIEWILTNKRLQIIPYSYIRDHADLDSIGAALTYIDVN